MNALEFLSYLRSLEIKISTDGDRLRLSAPKGVLTPTLREQLAERKAEILTFLHNANLATDSMLSAIQPVPRDGNLPLSSAQQRVWFLDQLEPGSSAYNIPLAYRLKGQLDVTALERSVREIVRRHEVLRTTFAAVNGQPIQVISPETDITLPIVNLQELPEIERETETQRLVSEEAQQLFDLAKGPLLRVKLLRLVEEEHILLVTMHHIVSDGWSFDVFFQALSALYEAFSTGKSLSLPELPIQYADFAHWQQQWLQSEEMKSQLAYWKQQLGGNLPVLELPTDRPRPPVQTYRGAKQSLVLPKNLSESLKALAQQQGVTLFMTLLAAFKTLLYRYTAQEDVIVGSPIAGRNRAEFEGLIGFFISTLVLRTNLSGNPSFRELLGRIREVTLEAYAHQDVPFEKLVEELQPERTLSRTPLFQVWFNMYNWTSKPVQFSGLEIEPFSIFETSSKFDLTLYVKEQNQEIELKLVYNANLFEPDRMAELIAQFQSLLEQIVTAPDKPIQSYSLVTPNSRSLLPNPAEVLPEPKYELITSLFSTWGKRTPEQPAVCQGDRTWTYSQLAISAEGLAKVLLAHGVERGEVVAVFAPRSFGLIASMLGVLLSGGVLLTLDPNLPLPRQLLMLQEAKAKCLLCVGEQHPEAKEIWESLNLISVNPDTGRAINLAKGTHLDTINLPELSPEDAAYVFFTSGTTGVPKGVLGCHKGLAHFLSWQRQTFAVGPQDRCAQLTGLSFDVVLRDIFLPLTSGATVYLPGEGDDLGATQILPWLERQQISLFHTVPSLAQSWLVNVPPRVSLRTLGRVFFAGEPLTQKLVQRWREAFPEAGEIVNLYGPTETTLAKCCYRVPADPLPGVQPVGSPLPETQALVLGKNNQVCGIGEPGEIVIRTPFRSLGYINASEENKQRFFQNPFRDDPQDLLYHTGDRGRYRPDGSLEILGRLDNQVKIRGVRIEPGEISTVLAQHPAVRETVVIAREDTPGDKRLVAYCVSHPQQVPTSSELRRFLKERLPAYMIPSTFVMLDALPLTPNGKVDRRALPAPDQVNQETDETFVAPQDKLEQQLTRIWEKVLCIPVVGIKDNFFDLGGHSLLAVRLFAEIEQIFGKKLPLATLFQAATVEDLAKVIRQEEWLAPWESLVAIQPNGSKPPLFCIQGVGGNILIYRDLAGYLGSEQPVYGLQARGMDGTIAPDTRVEDMAAHYILQIKTIQPDGPYYLAGLSGGGYIALEMAQQLRQQGQTVSLLAMFDTHGPNASKLLPPIPRFLSVLRWAIFDYVGRIMKWPVRLVSKLLQLGIKQTFVGILQKVGVVEGEMDEESRYQVESRDRNTRDFTKKAMNSSRNMNVLEKWLNVVIIFILQNSTKPYHAQIYAQGFYHEILSSLPEELQNVQEANLQALKVYDPQVYPGQMILFRATDRAPGLYHDPQLGWNNLITGGIETFEVPGSHESILKSPKLAERMKLCLAKAQAKSSSLHLVS
jgi:amino acid adenylation domain-containing protein